jgi:hypothetical protein
LRVVYGLLLLAKQFERFADVLEKKLAQELQHAAERRIAKAVVDLVAVFACLHHEFVAEDRLDCSTPTASHNLFTDISPCVSTSTMAMRVGCPNA